jgi:hypothetical protein
MKKVYLIFVLLFLVFTPNLKAQTYGCTDPKAANYNSSSSYNDGSCIYNLDTISPTSSFNLDTILSETSGLIKWNNQIWTHNDSGGDTNLYALDTLNGSIIRSLPLNGISNTDWEEISQDSSFIYIGDFGNNQNGVRSDLKILRVSKNSILTNSPLIKTINFTYSNQTNFTALAANTTDFDCEAFLVSKDSIYLFTKQWSNRQTSTYALPKNPGTHIAKLQSTMDVQGLITGSVYIESKKLVVLSGYSPLLQPFIYLLYDFQDSRYFSGNKRKIIISLAFHQVEGITTANGLKYYISNEYLPQLNILQKLHILDLSTFLENYLSTPLAIEENDIKNRQIVYPVPASNLITIITSNDFINKKYVLTNDLGQVVLSSTLTTHNHSINISTLTAGNYILKLGANSKQTLRLIKN